jgi:hypothetical protein
MKKVKTNRFLLMITLFLLGNGFVQAGSLKLEISLSKTVYLVGEPIWLDVTLTNTTQDTARMWGLCFPCGLGFEIIVIMEKAEILETIKATKNKRETANLLGISLATLYRKIKFYDLNI